MFSDVSSKLYVREVPPPSPKAMLTLPKCTVFTPIPTATVRCFVQKSDSSGFPRSPQRPFYKADSVFATFHSSGTRANVSNSLRISVNHSPGAHLGGCRNGEHYLVPVMSYSLFLADCSQTSPAEASTFVPSCALSLVTQGQGWRLLCGLFC